MNPNPFLVSNHFTTPFAAKIVALLFETVFTAAFDITNQFGCQDFYLFLLSLPPSLLWREDLPAADRDRGDGNENFLAAR